MATKLSLIFTLSVLISCASTEFGYTPVETNCKRTTNKSVSDDFIDVFLDINKDSDGNYVDDLEYKECIKRNKIKEDLNNKNYNELKDLYNIKELKSSTDPSIRNAIQNRELQELKRHNNILSNQIRKDK